MEREDGTLEETTERTGVWAWRHPHKADGTVTYTKLQGDVTFNDVDFGYDENKIVLHNIKLYATPGQKIAFVGSTGAGKTTITNLINRFYDIADGKIRYDGININKIKKADLRRSLGMVLQDTHLFTGTVMENIRYGRLDASDEECIAAAQLANADGFIRRLPDGYDTMLTGDGANLSQGQRQLLGHRPGRRGGPAGADPGRGHLFHRHPDRGPGPGGHGRPDDRADHLCHRPPPVHREELDCIMVLENGRSSSGAPTTSSSTLDRVLEGAVLPALYRQRHRGIKFHAVPSETAHGTFAMLCIAKFASAAPRGGRAYALPP